MYFICFYFLFNNLYTHWTFVWYLCSHMWKIWFLETNTWYKKYQSFTTIGQADIRWYEHITHTSVLVYILGDRYQNLTVQGLATPVLQCDFQHELILVLLSLTFSLTKKTIAILDPCMNVWKPCRKWVMREAATVWDLCVYQCSQSAFNK